jgi:hypothetical protein
VKGEELTVIAMYDLREADLMIDFLGQFKILTEKHPKIRFLLADMSSEPIFTHIAKKYSLGNFDTPGIFATQGQKYYYRNYQRYKGS